MKKLSFLVAALLATGFATSAKDLTVKSVQQLDTPDNIFVGEAVISADGNYVVMSDLATNSLTGVNLSTGASKKIAENGSMTGLKMTADGSKVVYRERVTDAKKRAHTVVNSVDVAKGKKTRLSEPTRDFSGFSLSKDAVVHTAEMTANNTARRKAKSVTGEAANVDATPVVGIHRGDLVLTVGNKTTILNPQGKGSYMWASISPDGKKIVYYKSQSGCYVCNLDGSGVVSLGYIHAPKWYGNDTVIGMQDFDNGTYVTESTLVAADMSGKVQKLTDNSRIAMYPSGSAEAGKIVFTDTDGHVFLLTVE